MPTIRRPSLDDRRRLVIYSQRFSEDGVATANSLAAVSREGKRNQAAYGSRVQRRLRARWYGLVPVKQRTLVAFSAALFSVVGLLGLLHWCAFWWSPIASHPELARPLRLDRPDSFGTWFSAVLMVATAGASFLVYQLRRYKSDDYHGHYRIWRIAILLSFVSSIDCVTGLVGWLGGAVDVMLAERDFLAGADWVRLLLGFGGAAFALRMVGEVARSRASAIVLGSSFVCYAIPLAVRLRFVEAELATLALVVPIATVLAKAGTTLAVVIYLRMLYREVRRLENGERIVVRMKQFFKSRREVEEAPATSKRKAAASDTVAARSPKSTAAARRAKQADQEIAAKSNDGKQEIAKPTTSKTETSKPAAPDGADDSKSKDGKPSFWQRLRRRVPADGDSAEVKSSDTDAEANEQSVSVASMRNDQRTQNSKVDAEKSTDSDAAKPKESRSWFGRKRKEVATEDEVALKKERNDEKLVRDEEDGGDAQKAKSSFLNRFRRKNAAAEKSDDAVETDQAKNVKVASVSAEPEPDASEETASKKSGWFSRFGRKQKAESEVEGDSAEDQQATSRSAAQDKAASDRGRNAVAGNTVPAGAAATRGPAPKPASANQSMDDDGDDDMDIGDEEDVDPDSIDWASLNKSERRRMRKVLKRQGKAA